MNEYFINIKVDREERPDLDKIYQTAHQLLVRRGGGWPLTVFLTPQSYAIFLRGLIFHHNLVMAYLLLKNYYYSIAEFYRNHRSEINQQNIAIGKNFPTNNCIIDLKIK